MKTIELPSGHFAEIYGNGLRFGLLDSKGKIYNGTTCCKDFFTDAFWCEHHKKDTSIHGFKCSPGRMDLQSPTYQIALHRDGESLGEKFANVGSFLFQFEKAFGIKPMTNVEPINEGKDLLFTFSREWTTRPVMISLYTGLMRVGMMSGLAEDPKDVFERLLKSGNPYGQYDRSEFGKKGVVPLILESLKTGKKPHPKQTFLDYPAASSAHHSGGFIAHTTGISTS